MTIYFQNIIYNIIHSMFGNYKYCVYVFNSQIFIVSYYYRQ